VFGEQLVQAVTTVPDREVTVIHLFYHGFH
jgi:hypothetical protein